MAQEQLPDWRSTIQPIQQQQGEAPVDSKQGAVSGELPDWRSTIVKLPTDKITGEPLPPIADGSSPHQPIRQSPVSVMQSLWLGLGEDKGRLAYLQQNFEGAMPVYKKDGSIEPGEFVVKDKGKWYTVDAPGLGEGTITDKAWEFAKDVARYTPRAAQAAVTAGAAVSATPAIGLVAGAASEYVRTQLGRIVGTYDPGSPLDQTVDMATEGLLNAGGIKLAQGVKPTASYLANKLEPWAESINKLPRTTKDIIKNTWARYSPLGASNFDVILERPKAVANVMHAAAKQAGSNPEHFERIIDEHSVKATKSLAKNAQALLNKIWDKQSAAIVEAADGSFKGGIDDGVRALQADAIGEGFASIRPIAGLADDTVKLKQFVQVKGGPVGLLEEAAEVVKSKRPLSQKAALDLINNNGGKIPEGFEFVVHQTDDIIKANKAAGATNPLMADEKSINVFRDFYSGITNALGGTKQAAGPEAAKQVLNFKRVLNGRLDDIYEAAASSDIKNKVTRIRGAADAYVESVFSKTKSAEAYKKMAAMYKDGKEALEPLITAATKGAKKPAAFQALMKQITSKGSRNLSSKNSLPYLTNLAKENAPEMYKDFVRSQRMIEVNEAAKAMHPIFKPNGSSGLLSGLYSAGTVPATSPRLQAYYIRLAHNVAEGLSDTLVGDDLLKFGFNQLRNISPELPRSIWNTSEALRGPLKNAAKDPATYQKIMDIMLRTPEVERGFKDNLLNGGAQGASQLKEQLKPKRNE